MTQCRFNFSSPRPGYQVLDLSFIPRRKGGLCGPSDCKGMGDSVSAFNYSDLNEYLCL